MSNLEEWRNRIIDYIKKNRVSTTEVADCLGKSGALSDMQPLSTGLFAVGKVKWVYGYNESNYSVHEQIRDVEEGDVIFIETFNCKGRAIIGELVTKFCLYYKQANAIISNAPFRDAGALKRYQYAVWCNGVNPIGCFNKKSEEELDAEIVSTHYNKYDGAIAVCDDCGVVIIPKECINEEMYNKLQAIEEQEDIWFDCLDRLKWDTFDIVCLKKYKQ